MRAFDNFYLPFWLRGLLQTNIKDEQLDDHDSSKAGVDDSIKVKNTHLVSGDDQSYYDYEDITLSKIVNTLKEEPGKTRETTFSQRYRFINHGPYWLGMNQLMGALSPLGEMWKDFKRAFRRSDSSLDTWMEALQIVRGFTNTVMALVVAVTGFVLLPFDLILLPFRVLAAPFTGYRDYTATTDSENNKNSYISHVANRVSNAVAAVWRDASYLLFSVTLAIRGITQMLAAPLVIALQWPFQRLLRALHGERYRSFSEKTSTKRYMKEITYHLEQMAEDLYRQSSPDSKSEPKIKKAMLKGWVNELKNHREHSDKQTFQTLIKKYDAKKKSLWTRMRHPHSLEGLFLELQSKAYKSKNRHDNVPMILILPHQASTSSRNVDSDNSNDDQAPQQAPDNGDSNPIFELKENPKSLSSVEEAFGFIRAWYKDSERWEHRNSYQDDNNSDEAKNLIEEVLVVNTSRAQKQR